MIIKEPEMPIEEIDLSLPVEEVVTREEEAEFDLAYAIKREDELNLVPAPPCPYCGYDCCCAVKPDPLNVVSEGRPSEGLHDAIITAVTVLNEGITVEFTSDKDGNHASSIGHSGSL